MHLVTIEIEVQELRSSDVASRLASGIAQQPLRLNIRLYEARLKTRNVSANSNIAIARCLLIESCCTQNYVLSFDRIETRTALPRQTVPYQIQTSQVSVTPHATALQSST